MEATQTQTDVQKAREPLLNGVWSGRFAGSPTLRAAGARRSGEPAGDVAGGGAGLCHTVERRPTLPQAVGGHTCERVPPPPTWHTCTSYVSTVKFKIFTAGKIAAVARTRTRTSPCWLGAVGFSGSRRPTAARGSLRARACAQRAPQRAPRACRPSCRMRMELERRSVNPRCGRVEVYPKSNPQQRGHSLLVSSHLLLPSVEGPHEYASTSIISQH